MTSREVILDGGLPWGFRMHGGADVQQPLRISRVNPGSKAALRGIREGDLITSINNQSTRSLTNTEAHSLIKTAGATLKLGLNQEFSGSPNKRRQYKTIQETHSETVKRSSITTYSIKSSRLVESTSVEEEANGAVVLNNNEVSKPQNGEPNKSPPSLIASQRSTLSTNGSSNPSTPTILTDHENLKSSPDNAELSNSSSIYTEQGTKDDMPDDKVASSKAKRRRARRKNAKNSKNQEENTTSKIIITKEFEETKLDYRVDSPDQTKERTKVTSKVAVTKSKSLDDDDLLKIQELSETSETEDKHESQAIISEAESELEWEETTNLQTPLSTLCLPIEEQCVEQVILISPEEELTLRNFLEGLNLVNSPEDAIKQTLEISTEDSMKARKAKKRAALEQYFLPMMQNPRYLDVICEETSDQSDLEPPPSIFTQHLKQGTPELDVIIPETTKSKPVLVETKLIEQGFCSTSNIGSVLDAEVVYINDSSSNSPNTLSDYEDCKEDINSSTESCEENLKIKVITELTPPPTPEISSPKSELNVPAEVDQEITALTENIKEKISCRNVISPPAPSRSPSRSSGSSSREASLCTIKYNPNSSIGDITSISKEDEVIKVYFEPSSLRELCLKCLASLPFGLEVLQELADVSLSIDSLTAKLPSDVLPKIARKLPAYLYDSNMNSNLPVSDSEAMPKWIGLPTETDPKLLMCLSPKQKDQLETTKATPNEADKLLELHEKFIQRRSYHEESKTVTHLDKSGCEVLINSPKNASNRLLAIIREEPQSPSVQTSAASSTSSKPNMNYSNRERSATLPRAHSQEVMNEARLKAKDLTEWLELARDKSRSDTNLWNGAELKCATTPLDTNKRVHQNTTTTRRLSLPQELYERQLLYLQEKEREVYRELERLEDEKRKLSAEMAPPKQFQTNEYHISRKGDYAENKSLRPHSMPVIPTEFLRQQMYDEYMHQIAEREERRQHKVIKLSSCKTNLHEETIKEANEIEDEFMKRVWQKHEEGKLNLERRKNSPEGGLDKIIEELGVLVDDGVKSKLPKHLQEFVDITKQASENSTDDDDGVWSPGQSQRQPERIYKEIQKSHQPKEEDPNIQPIWVPKSANSSPIVERKEFRPVNFQSPVLSRKSKPTTASFEHLTTSNSAEPSWKLPESSSQTGIALSASLDKRLTSSQSSPNIPSPRLPKAQNPTITLLQKAREGQLPRGAHYLDYQDQRRLPNDRAAGIVGPGEVLYKLKGEYTSESDSEHPRRMADLGQRKYEQGIGPTTKNGMPLTLRSEIKEGNQSKWYKRMYDTIHKQKPHTNEYVTVRYKQRRANYPYSSGYLSEPEPGMYDSDFTDYKYATLDRRRQPMNERHHENGASSTMPRNYANKSSSSSDIIRNAHESYRNQPGRIENYRPGHSSISEKEAKEWWDEVMDIFDGWLDDNSELPSYDYLFAKALARSHLDQQKRVPQNKSFINQALKSGYESDSTLVYRRKEEASQLLSPIEQKEAYKVIQKGGDVPLHGLRKPAPERPKDEDNFEYFPISPTLTRVRVHRRIKPQKEILCYPVTVHHHAKAPQTFAELKKSAPSSITIPAPPEFPPPPSPPRRRSSRNNSTLRLISTMKVKSEKSPLCKRHETCFSTTANHVDKTNVKFLRDKITCKLSPHLRRKNDNPKLRVSKTITTTPELKSRITSTLTSSKDPKTSTNRILSKTYIRPLENCCLRSRSSDSVRNVCRSCKKKVGTFGMEKRNVDLILPKATLDKCRKIQQSTELLSPTEVKKAVKNVTYKKSSAVLASAKNSLRKSSLENVLPIKVGVTDKGKNIIKTAFGRSASSSPKLTKSKQSTSLLSLSDKSTKTKSSLESLQSQKPTKKSTTIKSKSDGKKTLKSKKEQINDEIVKKGKNKIIQTRKCVGKVATPETKPKIYTTLAEIQKQKQSIQSDHFFQNLLLRDISPTPSAVSRNSWLLEKTHQLQSRRYSLSEPSIGAMKVYLKHTKPVSDSKFRSLDLARSRSASPKSVSWQNQHDKRSSSVPAKLVFSETSRPVSPIVKKRLETPPQSPTIFRSPSSRRIMQLKSTEQNQKDRSRSTSKKNTPTTLYVCPNTTRNSTSSLDSFESNEYQCYMKDLTQSSRQSNKFQDLNEFYADIERLAQLERISSSKPRKKCENEIIDYDRWQEVRVKERAEKELNSIYHQLKENEKEKGFLFTPKNIENYKWKKEMDRGLRIKEKSVDDIKENFEKMKDGSPSRDVSPHKDTYKPLWRGNSVVNLANLMTERRAHSESRVPTPRQRLRELDCDKMYTGNIGSRIWSSLSMEQVNLLKEQLADIYNQNSYGSKPKPPPPDFSIRVPKDQKPIYSSPLKVRRNSDSCGVLRSASATNMSESDKKMLSQSLSKELLSKLQDRKAGLPLVVAKEVRGAVAAADANVKPQKPLMKTNALSPNKLSIASETESASTDESTKTVVYVPKEDIKKKVEYFENVSDLESYTPTIYKPADDFGDASTVVSDKSGSSIRKSESCQSFKEYFGEQDIHKFATIPLSATRKEAFSLPTKPQLRALSPVKTSISEATSYDSLCRSRSLSPYFYEPQTLVKTGEVQRLKDKFEFLEDFYSSRIVMKPRRSRSDSDLHKEYQMMVPGQNFGYVDNLRRKYEYPAYSGRGRSRIRRGGVVSPIFLRAEDRFMPHINIISKIASLYNKKNAKENFKSRSNEDLAHILGCNVGEVEKLKAKFDSRDISLIGHMFTSSPNLRELKDITPYLTASWMAHKYPKKEDNTRRLSPSDEGKLTRAKSTSPQRSGLRKSSILKSHQRHHSADSEFDAKKHPVDRYQPKSEPVQRYKTWWTQTRPSVSFKDPEPPVPPPKGQYELRNLQPESPRKYVENEVTIHYKTPIRQEIKECLSEDELAYRQAEIMKKIYQEERRKKYLQELQDMNSRRHTDNFIPSQKSPISLNRYDDFEVILPPTKPPQRSPEPRLIAKALYNFLGQTSRELTFRKGDLIHVRRQVDKNWYEGELNAMVGLFPFNYVEIVPHDTVKATTTTPRKSYEGQARAKFNFIAQSHLELSLAKGELVVITRRVDDNWYEGKIGGKKGIFPVNYVDVLIDPHDPPPPSTKPVASPASHSMLHNGTASGKESMGTHLYTPSVPNPQLGSSYHAKPVQITGAGTYGSLSRALKNNVDQALHIETASEPIPYRALYNYNPQNDDELELLEKDLVFVLEKCDDGWYVGSSERTGAFGTFPGNYVEKI